MAKTELPADDFSELVDADLSRIDLVGKAASGHRALIAKAEASGKTMNDHPDSDFAYVEPGGTKDESGKTVPRSLRHFAIYDAAHTRNALARAPQSEFGEKAMPKIRAAAKKFGIDVAKAQEETPMPDTDTVAKDTGVLAADAAEPGPTTSAGADTAEGGSTDQAGALADRDADSPDASMQSVVKADDEVEAEPDAVDLSEPLADGTGDGIVGDENVPGSPAWEDVDAATARKWTAVLGRTKNALEVLSQREMIETDAGGDSDGVENAWDLQDAGSAIDYAIGVLAGYAASEEIEATIGTEALAAVGKAADSIDPEQLAVLEQLAPVVKAGRVLSAANETLIRDAEANLSKVLAALPSAPVADDVAKEDGADTPNVPAETPLPPTADSTEPVAVPSPDTSSAAASMPVSKEAAAVAEAVAAAVAKADQPEPEASAEEPVAKADDALAKVSEADLKRQALTGSGSEQKAALAELGLRVLMGSIGTEPTPDEAPEEAADETATTPDVAAGAPAPAPTPTPEEPVAKSAEDVLKEIIEHEVTAALTQRDEAHVAVVKALEDRIATLEAPAPPRVLSNGVQRDPAGMPMPEPHVMRGQNASELRHDTVAKEQWTAASDATERKAIGDEMERTAAQLLAQLHATRPAPRT